MFKIAKDFSLRFNWRNKLKPYLTPKVLMTVASSSSGLIIILIITYALTRPCVIGQCLAIPQSQQLAQQALADFNQANSTEDLLSVQEKLNEAIKQLKAIPPWSKSHSQAIKLLRFYQTRSQHLAHLIQAFHIATAATKLAENPPLPSFQWREIQQNWQQAIATLEQIPVGSPFYIFAENKIETYQNSLAIVNQRLQAEEEAINSLKAANEATKLAKARQNVAQTIEDWQLVRATWQTTIRRLREISPQTTVYPEAKALINTYMPQLAKAHTRQQQEEFAANLLHKAQEQATIAQEFNKQKQWSAAITHWRNSINYLQQVPTNTFQSNQIQPLIAAYTLSLKQTENEFKKYRELSQINQYLETTCNQEQKICDYQITDQAIKVTLTPAYLDQVWQTALQAKVEANVNNQIQLMNHISRLEQTWQMISNKSNKSLQIYNANGSLMVTYKPK